MSGFGCHTYVQSIEWYDQILIEVFRFVPSCFTNTMKAVVVFRKAVVYICWFHFGGSRVSVGCIEATRSVLQYPRNPHCLNLTVPPCRLLSIVVEILVMQIFLHGSWATTVKGEYTYPAPSNNRITMAKGRTTLRENPDSPGWAEQLGNLYSHKNAPGYRNISTSSYSISLDTQPNPQGVTCKAETTAHTQELPLTDWPWDMEG